MKKLWTLELIDRLAPGETMIAYVGNFEYDIARCDRMSMQDKGAPTYKAMIESLQGELQRLAHAKQIKMAKNEKKCQRTSNRGTINDWRDFEYEVTKLIW